MLPWIICACHICDQVSVGIELPSNRGSNFNLSDFRGIALELEPDCPRYRLMRNTQSNKQDKESVLQRPIDVASLYRLALFIVYFAAFVAVSVVRNKQAQSPRFFLRTPLTSPDTGDGETAQSHGTGADGSVRRRARVRRTGYSRMSNKHASEANRKCTNQRVHASP